MSIRLIVFRYAITHFGILRRYWLLTQLFDSSLAVLTALTAPPVTLGIAEISARILEWPDVRSVRHRLGGRQFNHCGAEMGHIHSNGVADIQLSRAEHDDVLKRHLAGLHHVAPQSSWVTLYVNGPGDVDRVLELFKLPFQRVRGGTQVVDDAPTDEDGRPSSSQQSVVS